ncbi:leucine-rich repeat protein, putative [Bodo saltans]|uniref:Leucine-rich repeat protein, putative n=1 Tax=Bodo saltans TaxID=75058 RepID=A0A0S4JWU2_BODSA|nr:leucine-rich repeat protein, putative [Bodo saltans]|eukprot:CUG93046.1 leucine-rich repeat protein, putative [Bodo saltans]
MRREKGPTKIQKRPRTASSEPLQRRPVKDQAAASSAPTADEVRTTVATTTPVSPPPAAATETAVVQLTEEEYLKKVSGRKSRHDAVAETGGVNMRLLATDPVYRILHHSHRSDVVEVVKCKFGEAECERAAKYLRDEFTAGPVRRLRLQLNVTGAELYMGRFFPFFSKHALSLRLLDLSRNQLTADDVVVLARTLKLSTANRSLEVLDLSCNRDIGNQGAAVLMSSISKSETIRAVILKHISLDDEGARMVAPYLASRPHPLPSPSLQVKAGDAAILNGYQWTGNDQHRGHCNFFLNLNENCLGPDSIQLLGKCLPEHVSLTVLHQRPKRTPQQRATTSSVANEASPES